MTPKRSYLARSVRYRLVAIGRLLAHVQSARESAHENEAPVSAVRADVQMVLARSKLTGAEAKKMRAVAELIGMLIGLLYVLLHVR